MKKGKVQERIVFPHQTVRGDNSERFQMNYFNIYLEGLALMYARMNVGMAINEGLFYPIPMTAIEIEKGISLEDMLFSFNPH